MSYLLIYTIVRIVKVPLYVWFHFKRCSLQIFAMPPIPLHHGELRKGEVSTFFTIKDMHVLLTWQAALIFTVHIECGLYFAGQSDPVGQ